MLSVGRGGRTLGQQTKHVRTHTHELKPLNHSTVVPQPPPLLRFNTRRSSLSGRTRASRPSSLPTAPGRLHFRSHRHRTCTRAGRMGRCGLRPTRSHGRPWPRPPLQSATCGAAIGYCRLSTRYVQRWPMLRARPWPPRQPYQSAAVTRSAERLESAAVARSARRLGRGGLPQSRVVELLWARWRSRLCRRLWSTHRRSRLLRRPLSPPPARLSGPCTRSRPTATRGSRPFSGERSPARWGRAAPTARGHC